jgi:anaerobic dimethyl sulfoxide reductase subunit B (iron-sulfur subunit)
MTEQLGFWIEPDRCVKCWSCQVACKAWKGTKPGTVNVRRVLDVWSGAFPDVTRSFISLSCMHCGDPACAAVCPTGAISKQADNGVVVVDQDKCIGCHYCFFACPFGVPQYGEDGTMSKCDYCRDRLAEGKEPACVATCPTRALHSGTMEELAKLAEEKAARKLVGATQPSVLVSP